LGANIKVAIQRINKTAMYNELHKIVVKEKWWSIE
jgi:hypothetical protein